jgi:hypothetical protein
METIKVTNSYIANAITTIVQGQPMPNPAAESLKRKKLPTKAQYWIRRALDKVTQNFKILEEARQGIIQQHSRKDEDGEPLIIMQDFVKIKALADELGVPKINEIEAAMKGDFISPKTAKAISEWSKGKIRADNNGNVSIENIPEFQKALNELMDIEVDLGINKIEVDLTKWETNPNIDLLDGNEMDLLLPMLDVK